MQSGAASASPPSTSAGFPHSSSFYCFTLSSSSFSYFTSYSCFTPPSLPLSCATLHPSPPRNELAALEDTDSSTGSCSGTRVRLEEVADVWRLSVGHPPPPKN